MIFTAFNFLWSKSTHLEKVIRTELMHWSARFRAAIFSEADAIGKLQE